jgi:phage gp36-like protein
MAWQSVTTAEIKTRLTGAEVTALQTAALASGQTDPLPDIVTQVVGEVRGYVAAGGYTLGTGETVPSTLYSATLAIIRYRIATRLPVKAILTQDRKDENDAAIRLLERVADGKFAVEEPTTASEETLGSPSPSFVTGKTLTMQRDDQDGI